VSLGTPRQQPRCWKVKKKVKKYVEEMGSLSAMSWSPIDLILNHDLWKKLISGFHWYAASQRAHGQVQGKVLRPLAKERTLAYEKKAKNLACNVQEVIRGKRCGHVTNAVVNEGEQLQGRPYAGLEKVQQSEGKTYAHQEEQEKDYECSTTQVDQERKLDQHGEHYSIWTYDPKLLADNDEHE
jgi:hypothetical protein